ncbi:hypothetical protein ACU4GR_31630 [Methylobacterium oryzae CBMB20]
MLGALMRDAQLVLPERHLGLGSGGRDRRSGHAASTGSPTSPRRASTSTAVAACAGGGVTDAAAD